MKNSILGLLTFSLCACAASPKVGIAPVTQKPNDVTKSAFEKLRGLSGEWSMIDDKGAAQPGVAFSVASAGSIVKETMFTGTPHEMLNVYHLDGASLIATHYCASGNQPQLELTSADEHHLAFKAKRVDNLQSDTYMGELEMDFVEGGQLVEKWHSTKAGGSGEDVSFTFHRSEARSAP